MAWKLLESKHYYYLIDRGSPDYRGGMCISHKHSAYHLQRVSCTGLHFKVFGHQTAKAEESAILMLQIAFLFWEKQPNMPVSYE